MRNLLLFISRFKTLFLFIALEVICLFLLVRNNAFQRAAFLNSANRVTGNLYQSVDNLSNYLTLKRINDSLRKENALLRQQVESSFDCRIPLRDTVMRYSKDAGGKPVYSYVPAEVINNSTNSLSNTLTLNKGTKHGVAKDMGVMGPNGVVGIVIGTSPHFSVVMSLLHKNASISGELARHNYVGNIRWDGQDPTSVQLHDIPKHVNVQKGDTVVTSGYSSFFPPGISIGAVRKVTIDEANNFYSIDLRLLTNFRSLEYVYVADYLFRDERRKVEEKADG
ncbi:MAG: rod shape-determining protein MreC [Bacteroidetes bacterium SW_11_45_7]|nr:MAG: rod shape-determining protein MreC [Bacteroidetes bacterium SW_11_45_7]